MSSTFLRLIIAKTLIFLSHHAIVDSCCHALCHLEALVVSLACLCGMRLMTTFLLHRFAKDMFLRYTCYDDEFGELGTAIAQILNVARSGTGTGKKRVLFLGYATSWRFQ